MANGRLPLHRSTEILSSSETIFDQSHRTNDAFSLQVSSLTAIDDNEWMNECIFNVLHFLFFFSLSVPLSLSSDQDRLNTLKAFDKHGKAHEQH